MHVRIHQGDNSIDIINLYQHVWRYQLDREGNTKCREAVWRKLRQVTTKIPQRNTLIVGGDFNCTIRRMKHHIGSAVIAAREPSPDQEEFLAYLQDHGMTLLNTWNAKPAYTCQTGDAKTQIDFLLSREQHADRTAKDCKPWHQAPIGKWKANHHVPVWASIRHVNPGKLPRKPIPKSFKSTLLGSVEGNDSQAKQLQSLVEQKISTVPSTGGIANTSARLDWIMTSTISEVYSPDARDDHRLSQDPQVQLSVRAMWNTYASYREAKLATFQNIFAKWRQFAVFHKTSRAYKLKTKEVKKERILQTAQELAQADRKGDQRKLWECAKRLAPWKPKNRTSLRGCAGEILAPQQQLSELIAYSQQKFCRGEPYNSQHCLDEDFWVDPVQLEQYLGRLPMRKAVPKHVAPAAAWRLCAKSVAGAIAKSANRSWVAGSSARMPQPWRDTHLVWLAKPNKDLDRPNGYRPIGLSHPLAKIINRILRDRLCEYVDPKLEGLPQFAYTKGRGVMDALLRVHHHFRKARTIALESKASIYQQHQGIKSKTCAGGLCFSLDLEGAFNSVPRTQLAASMRRLQISEDLIHMAMEFYRESRYFSNIGSHENSVTSTCGIKQGCTLAPYLFVIHTITIIEEIGRSLGNGWMKEMLTFFADDSIATWEIHCVADLKKALAGIETIIAIFNQRGMKLSNDKCVILYDLQGREAHKFVSKRKHRRNKLPHFKFLQMGEDLWVPIRKHHEYLGTIIAYRDAAARTCAHRMKKARGQYSQLRKTINSARIVSNRPRYQIWRSGVLSSAAYGLLATGVTFTSKKSLQAMTARQIRAIARRPAHLTHVTNEEVRSILHAEDPVATLIKQGTDLLGKLERLARDRPQDIRSQPQAREQLQYVLGTLRKEEHQTVSPTRPEAADQTYKCSQCDKSYTSMTSLKKHMAISHKIKFQGGIKFDAARHAQGNLPQCAYCGHKFGEWHGLRMHIERVNCHPLMLGLMQADRMTTGDAPVVEPPRSTSLTALEDPEIVRVLSQKGWKSLLNEHCAHHFMQHCCLCNRWIRDPSAVKRHLSQAHVAQWEQVAARLEARCAEIKHMLDRGGICPWCSRVSYSRHFKQCNVVFQCALLGLIHEDGGRSGHSVRQLAASAVSTARNSEEAPRTRPERRAAEQTAPPNPTRTKGKRPENPGGQSEQHCLDPGGPVSSTGRCPKQSTPRQLTHIPSRTDRTGSNSQSSLRSWAILAREEGTGGAASGPPNGSVRTDGDGDQGQARSLCPGPNRGQGSRGQAVDEPQQTVRVPTMESPGAKARARPRSQRASSAAPPGIGHVLQGSHHHKVQLGAQDEAGTGGEREGDLHHRGSPAIPRSSQSPGAAVSASQQYRVEPCGSANAPTILEKTWTSGCPPESSGSRLDGPTREVQRGRSHSQ